MTSTAAFLAQQINANGFVRGWNQSHRFGVRVQDGEVTSLFPVNADWDGYRFHGYDRATRAEVLEYYGSKGAAMAAWTKRFGGAE
jgi:predicted metal-dependent hydrolase